MFNSSVRNAIVASILTLPVISLLSPSALADKSNFWIRNDSSSTIAELYLSSSGHDVWDNDLLDEDILESGSRFQVSFADKSANACLYDIRAVFTSGDVVEDYQINVCENEYYSFFDQ
jgi:hypothetical protein